MLLGAVSAAVACVDAVVFDVQKHTLAAFDDGAGPAGVISLKCMSLHAKIWIPSSSSNSFVCLLTPGCEV